MMWNNVAVRGPAEPIRPPLVIGCGALGRELVELTRRSGLPAMDLTCLPASLHNRPERIPDAVAARIRRARADGYDRIFIAYADCGTGGLLDRLLEAEGVARLAGAHCYEVYAGRAAFATLADEEPGTFYLTDYLVRSFDGLVIRGLGLDRHPELLPVYFGNYRRLVYLAQTDDPDLTVRAEAAARRLGLDFERRLVGLGELGPSISAFARARTVERNMFQPTNMPSQDRGDSRLRRRMERQTFQPTEEGPDSTETETVVRPMEQVLFQGRGRTHSPRSQTSRRHQGSRRSPSAAARASGRAA